MPDPRDQAEALLEKAYADTLSRVPSGATIFDAHTHVGDDIDGFYSRRDELLAFLDRSGAVGAFTFCLDEPDREPAFTAANDRTMADAAQSGGRLLPFVRLDLEDSPIEEARRVLDLGARGIKLHPRAQQFSVGDARLDPVFGLSAEFGVPILIHAGRGMPKIADELAQLMSSHERAQLIIAHAGVADLDRLTGHFSGRPGVVFDTAVFNFFDLADLMGRVAPEQVVYASDYPYGQHPGSLHVVLCACAAMGYSDEQTRAVVGGTSLAIADGSAPTPTSAPGERELRYAAPLLRIHHYLAMALPMLWMQMPDRIGVMGLALNTCQTDGPHEELLGSVAENLACAHALWELAEETEDEKESWTLRRTSMRIMHLADVNVLAAGE